MIKFNELRSFFASELRDEYNASSHTKRVIHINPNYIIALEAVEVGGQGVWPSSWEATRINTVKGHWLVEGNINTVSEIISNTSR